MMTAIKLRVSRMDCSRVMSSRESLVYFWGRGPYQVWYYTYINMIQQMNECVYGIRFYVMHLGKVSINGREHTMRTSFEMMPYFHERQKFIFEQVNQLSTYKKIHFVCLRKRTQRK